MNVMNIIDGAAYDNNTSTSRMTVVRSMLLINNMLIYTCFTLSATFPWFRMHQSSKRRESCHKYAPNMI